MPASERKKIEQKKIFEAKFQPLQSFQLFHIQVVFFCFPEILVYHHGARRWVCLADFRKFHSGDLQAVFEAQKLSEDLDPTKSGMAGDPLAKHC